MKDLYSLTGTEGNPSTAYHPETDGQSERMVQEIKQYLKLFVDYRQTNWNKWLTSATFAYNNRINSSTNVSPFFANYGRHPNTGHGTRKAIKSQTAQEFSDEMKKIWEEVESSLKLASEQMKHFYDKRHSESRNYQVGDKVWLEGQNITTDRPSKTLDDRRHGPFPIVAKVGVSSYKLKLPKTWKNLHPVINKIFLTPYHEPKRPQLE